jgi:hypothetical protein
MAMLVMFSLLIEDARNSCENNIHLNFLTWLAKDWQSLEDHSQQRFVMGSRLLSWSGWKHTHLALRISANSEMFMISNFAPMDECPPCNDVEIVGTFLRCLNIVYRRNGNNPHNEPSSGYQYFDGDNMLHVVKIRNGRTTYYSYYTCTNMYVIYNNFNNGNSL